MKVVDEFVTFQGSGHLVGKRQYFVRLAGCHVKCPIRKVCDEQEALPSLMGNDVAPSEVAERAVAEVGEFGWIHITGGEPCEQPEELQRLGMAAESRKLRVHLHTSGMLPVPIRTDWLTVSPKSPELQWNRNNWAQECIVVYDQSWVIDVGVLRAMQMFTNCYDYYLQPLWMPDGSSNVAETLEMLDRLNRCGCPWDLSLQVHKFIGIK